MPFQSRPQIKSWAKPSPAPYRRPRHPRQSRLPTRCSAAYFTTHLISTPINASLFSSLPAIAIGVTLATGAKTLYNRLFRRRRPRHRASTKMDGSRAAIFSVATYNLRGIMDRWTERKPVLKECLKEMDADVLCFQECLTGEYGQDRQLLDKTYHIFPCKAALFNLLSNNGAMRIYARMCTTALDLLLFQRFMVRLPVPLESMREKLNLSNGFFRILRDLAIAPFFGNSIACRLADAHEIKHSTLLLGDWRAAQRIEFSLGDGTDDEDPQRPHALVDHVSQSTSSSVSSESASDIKIWVVNTHLDHDHPDNRQRQAQAVAAWMEDVRNEAAAVILCGDFNGGPAEPFHKVLKSLGYRSAYKEHHGREPEGTWPTGIQAPLMDHGKFETLDYIYVWEADGYEVKVLDAQVFGAEPAKHDSTLYPSDHAALKATLEVKARTPVQLPQEVDGVPKAAH